MILNAIGNRIVSSLRWAEKSGLLIIEIPTRKTTRIEIGGAEYISLKKISDLHFLSLEHYAGSQFVLTVRPFDNPVDAVAKIVIKSNGTRFSGDLNLWQLAPQYYVEYLKDGFNDDFKLIHINANKQEIDIEPLVRMFDERDVQ